MATTFPTDVLFPFTTGSAPCGNADYIFGIYEEKNEELLINQTLASRNCEYLLRSEPEQLTLYSISSESLESINIWSMGSDDTIWTLHQGDFDNEDNHNQQWLTLSNTGCVRWHISGAVDADQSRILDKFCDPSFQPFVTTNFYSTTDTDFDPINYQENVSKSAMDTTDIIYITIGASFIVLIFGLLCIMTFCKHKNRKSQALFNKKSNKYINSGWDADENENEADLDLNYGDRARTKQSQSKSQSRSGSDIAKGGYIVGQSAVEYGLKVPIKYDINDSDTDEDENGEIRENELGYFMNNSQESYAHDNDNAYDHEHGALMDLDHNINGSNRTVQINLSDISDESTSSEEAPEPEIVHFVSHNREDKKPTKVKKGGEFKNNNGNNKNRWGKFNLP
eukprot:CAMPEP_0201578610 /NCGR_PEP_ID=MMETSP0190_2-20130828/25564_1 /ASSEMBLY_ACC=CAM_ASM_000263 /TAXON_ID=37353 /ORGANISM="Rosalina sp." /LENGTH=394 /DNA_ID=CAMNT_0048011985 /DNA_START=30 /DNA_END=1214 /DNA_ORIENTATION=-